MHRRFFPVFSIRLELLAVKAQLIEPECDLDVFGLPLLLIGIHILHRELLHDPSAAGIVNIVGRRYIVKAVPFQLFYDGFSPFGYYSPVPKRRQKTVSQIKAVALSHIYIAYGYVIRFKADGVVIARLPAVF